MNLIFFPTRLYFLLFFCVFSGQVVRVYPAGMRIDSSNFNPISVWSCGIQMAAMNYQTVTDTNLHLHNSFFEGTHGYILKPAVMWNSSHILFERFLPASKNQEGLHVTHISLTILSGQYVCRENYSASPLVEVEVSLKYYFFLQKFVNKQLYFALKIGKNREDV